MGLITVQKIDHFKEQAKSKISFSEVSNSVLFLTETYQGIVSQISHTEAFSHPSITWLKRWILALMPSFEKNKVSHSNIYKHNFIYHHIAHGNSI